MFLKTKLMILIGVLCVLYPFVGYSNAYEPCAGVNTKENLSTNNNVPDNTKIKLFNSPKETFKNIIRGPKGTFSKFLMIIIYGLILTFIINLPMLIRSMSLECPEKTQMGIAGRGMIFMGFFLVSVAITLFIFFNTKFWAMTFSFASFLSLYVGSMFKKDSR